MKEYYITDEKKYFWCENDFGYWSNFKESLKYRFEGIWLWVFPLYLLMKFSNVNCKMEEIKEENND